MSQPEKAERDRAELARALAEYEHAVTCEREAAQAHDRAAKEENRTSCALSNAKSRTEGAWRVLEDLRKAMRGAR